MSQPSPRTSERSRPADVQPADLPLADLPLADLPLADLLLADLLLADLPLTDLPLTDLPFTGVGSPRAGGGHCRYLPHASRLRARTTTTCRLPGWAR